MPWAVACRAGPGSGLRDSDGLRGCYCGLDSGVQGLGGVQGFGVELWFFKGL